jgi:hypothetical protein
MTRTLLGVIAVIGLTACEPTFVDVTFDGIPKCEGSRLESEIVLKMEGPRVSFFQRVTGDGAPVSSKLVAGKLYKLKAYKCVSEPCENEKNLFHGADVNAPEGKTGRVTLSLPGAPACVSLAPPPVEAPAEDAGTAPAL